MTIERISEQSEYVAEIGFGDGKKIGRLALANPETIYIGFEVPTPPDNSNKVDSALPNLSLNYTGAFEGLSQLPVKSISTIMMDLVLEGDFTLTQPQWKAFFPNSTVNREVRYCDIPYRSISPQINKVFDFWRNIFLTTAKRALRDDGQLIVHTYQQDLRDVKGYLSKAGFIFEYEKSPPEETSESKYMKGITQRIAKKDPRFGPEGIIYTIIAKKDLSQKETKLLPAPESKSNL